MRPLEGVRRTPLHLFLGSIKKGRKSIIFKMVHRYAVKETLYFITHEDLSRVVIRLCLTAFSNNCVLS